MKLPRLSIALAIAAFMGVPVPAAKSAVVVSNLLESTFSSSPLQLGFWFGNRFVTDNSASSFTLDSVTLNLAAPNTPSGNFFVALYSDSSTQPETQLGLLSGSNPTTAGNFTFTSAGLSLQPNTSYWVVAGVSTGAAEYAWNLTSSSAFTGSWTIPATATHIYSFNQGGVWQPAADGFARQFSVSATAVPEPSAAVLLGLGFAAWLLRRNRGPGRPVPIRVAT